MDYINGVTEQAASVNADLASPLRPNRPMLEKMVYDVSVEYILTSAKIVAAAGCVYRWLALFRAEARLLEKVERLGACLKALMPRLSCSIGVRSDCP